MCSIKERRKLRGAQDQKNTDHILPWAVIFCQAALGVDTEHPQKEE